MPVFPESAELETASLEASQSGPSGNPFSLGSLHIFHINSATIDNAAFGAALADVGVVSTDETPGPRQLDILTEFQSDLDNQSVRGSRTQYRMEFPTATNSNNTSDQSRFSRSSLSLVVRYVSK